MKYSLAAVSLLAGLGCAHHVRDVTRLFSVPPQPTPNESTPTNIFTILPIVSSGSSNAPSSTDAVSDTTATGTATEIVPTGTDTNTAGPTTIGHITPDPTTSGATTATSSGGQTTVQTTTQTGTQGTTQSGTASGTRSGSSSGTPSTTSNPAAAPTAFGNHLMAGLVALAGLAVAI